jgi:Tol biopolymer transport system component
VVYWSGNGEKAGVWKVRADGSQPTRLVAEKSTNLPEVSPDGRYASFVRGLLAAGGSLSATIAVVRVSDGAVLPFEIHLANKRLLTAVPGRSRWSADGKKLYFIAQDEKGVNGVFVQDFDPELKDTSATRKKVAAFDPDVETESFAVSPDGKSVVIAGLDQLFGLAPIEGVPGAGRRR